jgi:hypothetical protein
MPPYTTATQPSQKYDVHDSGSGHGGSSGSYDVFPGRGWVKIG